MEDNRKGAVNKSPVVEDFRVGLLSPSHEAFDGPRYLPSAFGTPADNAGFFPEGTKEVADEEFRSFPEGDRDRTTDMWKKAR